MMWPVIAWTGLLAGLAVAALTWRKVSQHHSVPCPAWLAWILENPYTNAIAGSSTLLDRAEIQPGMTVLDVGAGPGRVSIPAAYRVGPNGQVVAVDVQAAMMDRLRARADERGLRNLSTVCGAIENLADGGEHVSTLFDRALLVTVLGEIPDRLRAMRAIHALLRPGGMLSVTEFVPDPHFQPRRSVQRVAEAAGFELDRVYGSRVAFTMNFRRTS